jgi:hypothetical protein
MRTDRHDEAKSRFSKFCERAKLDSPSNSQARISMLGRLSENRSAVKGQIHSPKAVKMVRRVVYDISQMKLDI